MFSMLPLSVRREGWENWENTCMGREDKDAGTPIKYSTAAELNASDSEMSCLSAADSTTSRRRKLGRLVSHMNLADLAHLRTIKRTAQKSLHNARSRKSKGQQANQKYLDSLLGDVVGVMSWHTEQPRDSDGKFRQMDLT